MNFRQTHIDIIKALGVDAPKRTALTVEELAVKCFKSISDATTQDRAARNAVRKPRKEGLIEISERGTYRLTPAGLKFLKKVDSYAVAPDRGMGEVSEKAPKKSAKKAVKKSAKKAAKKVAKTKTAKAPKAEKTAKAPKVLTKVGRSKRAPVNKVVSAAPSSEKKPRKAKKTAAPIALVPEDVDAGDVLGF